MVDEAARMCVESGACRYSYSKKLLNKEQDRLAEGSSPATAAALPTHDNLRGKEAYR